jgi:serine/threonine protein kinase
VIRIHDLGEDGPLMFLSMEYVDGETLWSRVKTKGPLPVPQAREILSAIAAGVAAAHSAGVVHRDLKPQNVILGNGGRIVKVIDFGLAKSSFQAGQTATGIIQGTPEYMAPEQVRGMACDSRTDVYALGATAYYALTGRPPFQGDTPIAIGFAQVHDKARAPRELRPEIPANLEAAILRALDKDPAARFSDAEEWRKQLAG